jgi:DNA modification methylase
VTTTKVYAGDCRVVMKHLIKKGFQAHTCITDSPYHLLSIVKRFGKQGSAPAQHGSDGRFSRMSAGFNGKTWDGEEEPGYQIAHDPAVWKLILDCLLPGGFLFAFSSAKTGHRMAVAMEDAGFTIHPFIPWLYAQGFPKAHAVGEDFPGWYHGGQTLNPAVEPIYVGQKPRSEKTNALNMAKHGTGAFNIDAARQGTPPEGTGNPENLTAGSDSGRWPSNVAHDGSEAVLGAFPAIGRNKSAASYFPSFKFHGKATKADKAGFQHPTIKPIGLLRWLAELSTVPGGTILDPFAGTGTMGKAAELAGYNSVLIERDPDYLDAIEERLGVEAVELAQRNLLG